MLSLSPATRIFVALDPVDMRRYVECRIIRSAHLSEWLGGFWPAFFSCLRSSHSA